MQFSLNNVNSIQIFNLIRFVATIGIGIGLTKIGLDTTEIAIYETLLFLGNMLSFFWIGGGQSALLALFPRIKEEEQGILIFQTFVVFSFLGIVTAAALLFLADPIVRNLTHFETLPYIHWLALYLMLNIPAYLVHIYYLLLKENRAILSWGIVTFTGQLLVVLVAVWWTGGLEMAFIGLVCLAFLKYLWTLALVFYRGTFRISLSIFSRYLAIGLPLLLNLLIGNSTEYIDGLIVTSHFTDQGTFAVFRYGARELPLVTLIVGGLITALLPTMAGDEKAGLQDVRQRTLQFANWLFPVSAVLMLITPIIFPIVYTKDFLPSAFVFNVYLLIIISRMILPQLVIISRNRSYILVRNAVLEMGVNVGLSLIFVRYWGLTGIAFATVIAFFLAKCSLMWYVWNRFEIRPTAYIPVRSYALYSGMLVACYFLSRLLY